MYFFWLAHEYYLLSMSKKNSRQHMSSLEVAFGPLLDGFNWMRDMTAPRGDLPATSSSVASSMALSTASSISTASSTRPDAHSHLVIYDFDDTLFPTSTFRDTTFSRNLLSDAMLSALDRLDMDFAQLVRDTASKVRFVIVTNATEAWLHMIMPAWMPRTYAYFGTLISILSAPDRNTNKYRLMWNTLLKGECAQLPILSVGDGIDEEIATRQIKRNCPKQPVVFARARRGSLPVGIFLTQLARIFRLTVAFLQNPRRAQLIHRQWPRPR